MKRYRSSFLLLFSLLFVGYKAGAVCPFHQTFSRTHSTIVSDIPNAFPVSSMQEKIPRNEHAVMLFRLGIEGKGLLMPYRANINSIYVGDNSSENALTNASRLKYILSFSGFLALNPEFLSAFSFHAPPILC